VPLPRWLPNKQIAGEIHRNSRANRIVEGRIGIAYGENLQHAEAQTHLIVQIIRESAPAVRGYRG
jgi:hypothetical protein